MRTTNRKGMEMAIGTVATVAIILIVLVIVVGFFFGGFGDMAGSMSDVGSGGTEAADDMDVNESIGDINKIWEKGLDSDDTSGGSSI